MHPSKPSPLAFSVACQSGRKVCAARCWLSSCRLWWGTGICICVWSRTEEGTNRCVNGCCGLLLLLLLALLILVLYMLPAICCDCCLDCSSTPAAVTTPLVLLGCCARFGVVSEPTQVCETNGWLELNCHFQVASPASNKEIKRHYQEWLLS